jgi:SAM-dependent methyltransferase
VSFEVAGEAYDRFMGRYSVPLAARFADWLEVSSGQRAIDVGCGPGALTGVLVGRLGADSVRAVDPSAPFVDACRERFPGVDVRQGVAEALPFDDDEFDVAGACLVVHFMTDPVAGVGEMRRVTRSGGWVGATVWDLVAHRTPMSVIGEVLSELVPEQDADEEVPVGSARGLEGVLDAAGLSDIEVVEMAVTVAHPTFEEWWEPFQHGVGPIGQTIAALDPGVRGSLEEELRARLGQGPFERTGTAFAGRGRV